MEIILTQNKIRRIIIYPDILKGCIPEPYRTQWIKALESNEYKQCRGNLVVPHKNNKKGEFCCLGVWGKVNFDLTCDEMIANGDLTELLRKADEIAECRIEKTWSEQSEEWIRNTREVGRLESHKDNTLRVNLYLERLFIELNDNFRWSFPKIAKFIKEYI